MSKIKILFLLMPINFIIELLVSTTIIGWIIYSCVNEYSIQYNLSVLVLLVGIDLCNGYVAKIKFDNMFKE